MEKRKSLQKVVLGKLGSSVQSLSHVWPFANPWTAAHQASLYIKNSWSLLKLMPIKLLMPSNHLIHCPHFLLLPSIFPSIEAFSNESALRIRWPKYWSFSFNMSLSNEYSGLISLRIDWFDRFAVWGLSRVFSSTTVQKHQFLGIQPFYLSPSSGFLICLLSIKALVSDSHI